MTGTWGCGRAAALVVCALVWGLPAPLSAAEAPTHAQVAAQDDVLGVSDEREFWAALLSSREGVTVRLDRHIVLSRPIVLENGQELWLDLNGRKLGWVAGTADTSHDNAIVVMGDAMLFLFDTSPSRKGTVLGGSAGYGGCILNEGYAELTGITVSGGHATRAGGGILNVGTMKVTGCAIEGCSAEDEGGGVYNGGELTIAATIRDCTAPRGAAIMNAGHIEVSQCTISDNTASTLGGALAIREPTDMDEGIADGTVSARILGSAIHGNVAPVGAAIGYEGTGQGTLGELTVGAATTISGNVSTDGPVISLGDVRLALDSAEIVSNRSGGHDARLVSADTAISLAGKVIVRDNVDGAGRPQNLTSGEAGSTLRITGQLLAGSKVFLRHPHQVDVATYGYGEHNAASPDTVFFADDESGVNLRRGEVTLCRPVDYTDAQGATQTCTDYDLVGDQTQLGDGSYVVVGSQSLPEALRIDGHATLVVCDGGALDCPKGVLLEGRDSSLAIFGQTPLAGVVDCTGEAERPGIGARKMTQQEMLAAKGYDIEIYGVRLTAEGGSSGAGIGGNDLVDVTIGGSALVSARGGKGGAGIGGNADCGSASLHVSHAVVEARGGSGGAGIGGGFGGGFEGNVIIDGRSTVKAAGGQNAAGIGSGSEGIVLGGTCTISGSTVDAIAGGQSERDRRRYGALAPIGYGNLGFGELGVTLSDDLCVEVADKGTVDAADRVGWCTGKADGATDSVHIGVCTHPQLTYTPKDGTYHTIRCANCLAYGERQEPHAFFGTDTTCVCGFRLPLFAVRYVSGTDEHVSGPSGTTLTLADGAEIFETPVGKAFDCWVVSMGEREPFEARAGDVLELTADATLAARWRDHDHALEHVAERPPTCTEAGLKEHWRCVGDDGCGLIFADAAGTEPVTRDSLVMGALGHLWSEPTFSVDVDTGRMTGRRQCARDPRHTETETVAAHVSVLLPASPVTEGRALWRATFENPAFGTHVMEASLGRTGPAVSRGPGVAGHGRGAGRPIVSTLPAFLMRPYVGYGVSGYTAPRDTRDAKDDTKATSTAGNASPEASPVTGAPLAGFPTGGGAPVDGQDTGGAGPADAPVTTSASGVPSQSAAVAAVAGQVSAQRDLRAPTPATGDAAVSAHPLASLGLAATLVAGTLVRRRRS